MSYSFSEQDPLLPKGSNAPEIFSSRPESLNDESSPESREEAEQREERRNNLRSLIARVCLLLSFAVIIIPSGFLDRLLPSTQPKTIGERVDAILSDTPLIDSCNSRRELSRFMKPRNHINELADGHNDLAILIRFLYDNQIYSENFTKPFEEGNMYGHVDLPRLRSGKNGGAFWSAFVPCPANGTDFSDENYGASVAFTLSQIDLLNRLQAAYPLVFSPPPNSTTALSHFRSGQLISPLAIEGLHQIGNSLSNLRHYHSLGVRYATLTHNCHNKYADAALVELPGGGIERSQPLWGGVSPAGRELVQEMNRLGMIVDLSHVSTDTMQDVLGGSEDWTGSAAPIIFSHSSAYAICPHPRNVPDDILKLVKRSNSVVMVNFSPDFISCTANATNPSGVPDFNPTNSTIGQVARHVMHIGELIGYDHVGFGSDFDGIPEGPKGLEDVSKYPDLVAELLIRGVTDEDARKVVGGNVLRVWRDVDAVAERLQRSLRPAEDKLPKMKFGEAGIGLYAWNGQERFPA